MIFIGNKSGELFVKYYYSRTTCSCILTHLVATNSILILVMLLRIEPLPVVNLIYYYSPRKMFFHLTTHMRPFDDVPERKQDVGSIWHSTLVKSIEAKKTCDAQMRGSLIAPLSQEVAVSDHL